VKDFDGAFAAYEHMNEIGRADPSLPEERAAAYRAGIRRQYEQLTPQWAASWNPAAVDDRPSPVFLVGFPRSGTTLLDTILMSHPLVEVLEEEPTLKNATDLLGGFEALADVSNEKLKAARDLYFETAQSRTPLAPGHLLIDKNPLAMNSVPAIRRLFPDARIILAIRHPCDVVLSCFVTNFKLNDGMANFLRLDTAAELYDLSFRYFERARDVLQPPVHTIIYENIVADRDRELRPLFDLLALDWHDSVLQHEETARSRGHIKTASYAQVVEPIYTRSAGRWQNYREHLQPVIPVLMPWAEKFGYEI
jgi:Sulfotransferase family